MSAWQSICDAPQEAGIEIIGCRWGISETGRFGMIREPFISFWSPTLGKFYLAPTHFTPMPDAPKKAA